MKPNRNATELAARLATAASKPPTLPVPDNPVASEKASPVRKKPSPPPTTRPATPKGRPTTDTIGISLRPARTLLQRYTIAAAERTRQTGRVVSAQEIMLEQLEHGPS